MASPQTQSPPSTADLLADGEVLDLRGVQCPLNWARAKVRLDELGKGARIRLILDDPRSVRDLPRAAEAQGHAVAGILERDNEWWIDLEF